LSLPPAFLSGPNLPAGAERILRLAARGLPFLRFGVVVPLLSAHALPAVGLAALKVVVLG